MALSHFQQRRARGGFTLVELMMVVFILGMLAALLLSAVQSARETGRRAQCLHKIHEISIALQKFETEYQQYPGWQHHPFWAINAEIPDQKFNYSTGWFPQLFPYLGYEYLFDRTVPQSWRRPIRRGTGTISFAPSLHTVAVCPSDATKMDTVGAMLSYAVNCGARDVEPTVVGVSPAYPADWRANGMFLDYWDWRGNPNNRVTTVKMDSSFIMKGDGLANTLMVSENLDATLYYDRNETNNGFVFDWPMPAGFKAINGPGFSTPYEKARPSSNHPGGVNAAFASGSARFLRDNMDYLVYIALMTSKGAESRPPGDSTKSWSPPIPMPKVGPDDL